ncbi:hypothetical protein [Roseovarius sp. MMSF_3281]|uniref:hypothetical protein n=1 Tax=Roseovarius sp. MMSF_3281 TaxID=3046694 RepID=UPI0027402364|nr:hypothetical protein [Roseovarius sp. MMSF_3281]
MIRVIFAAAAIALLGGNPALAQCADITDSEKRLECYDAMANQASGVCEIEDFNYSTRGSYLKVTGAMTCADGKMNYRLYDGDDNFLTAGFTYFEGYALTILERIEAPDRLNIKYSIEQR